LRRPGRCASRLGLRLTAIRVFEQYSSAAGVQKAGWAEPCPFLFVKVPDMAATLKAARWKELSNGSQEAG